RPRVEGEMRRPGHPGTAVRIGEELFEVVAAEKSGGEWIYRLEPWTGQDTIRVYVEWSEESEHEFAAGLRDDRIRERKNFLAWGAQAFLGFLPAKNQERLSQVRGLDPARATFWSAVLETLVASPFALLFVINSVVGGMGGWGGSIPGWAGVLGLVAMVEGVFRLVAVISTGDPIGSLFLAFLGFRLKPEGPRYVPDDEISAVEGLLNVVSPVPKVWWERAGGVTYGGEPYMLVGSGHERTKFSYRFQKGGEGFPLLDPELEKVRNRSSDLSYVYAPLWGFLPADLQQALEFYGRYRPRPYVILSICFNVLLAIAIMGPGLRNVSRGVFEIGSLVLLAAAGALLMESIARLLRLMRDGRATGSFLAFLVKPVFYLAIKDRPVPPS
ncbi:MAG: hypothetical protein OEW18_09505, partial [Candidatus Aminicenantes bacterium]|nr:hypothetical protein [Candidatus Aminicenantes bacterium]